MRTTIFYFSGTGNCLKTARDLAGELGDADVIPIPKAIRGDIDLSAECIGVVYPVYMFGIPLILSDFIKKLPATADKYIFAVATYAGCSGAAIGLTESGFKKQDLELSAGFVIKMPSNYTPFGGAIAPEKQQKMFAAERHKVKDIVRIVKERRRHLEKSFLLLRPVYRAIYKACAPSVPTCARYFWTDERCNSCGVCEKVCPVGNITLPEGKPVWGGKCEQCFACLQWCPQESIQYSKSTRGKARYRNPDITVTDIIEESV